MSDTDTNVVPQTEAEMIKAANDAILAEQAKVNAPKPAKAKTAKPAAKAKPGMEPKKAPFKKGEKRKAELAKLDAAKASGKPAAKPERKMLERHQVLWDAADKGRLPDMKQVTLDFLGEDGKGGKGAKPTHKSWVSRFRKVAEAIKAKDLKALRADNLKPDSSSRVIICRYRDLAIRALETKAKADKKDAKGAPQAESQPATTNA